jgi:hypothetical protein
MYFMLKRFIGGILACTCAMAITSKTVAVEHDAGCPLRAAANRSVFQPHPNLPFGGESFGIRPAESAQEPPRPHDPERDHRTTSPERPVYGISAGAPIPPSIYIGGY